jgi:hypothetical protein
MLYFNHLQSFDVYFAILLGPRQGSPSHKHCDNSIPFAAGIQFSSFAFLLREYGQTLILPQRPSGS